jgi:hypothetical protein
MYPSTRARRAVALDQEKDMFIAMNRFRVKKGSEEAFEHVQFITPR